MSSKQQNVAEKRRLRAPVQERSQKRIEAAKAATEKLLIKIGPERTSIPEIASAAKVPRASIYQYFPDKYALFAELAETHFKRITEHAKDVSEKDAGRDWQSLVRTVIRATAEYYNANKVAGILLLMGPFSLRDRRAYLAKDEELSTHFRAQLMRKDRLPRLPQTPDVVALAIEIAFACFKYGYTREGKISTAICDEAARAVIRYLEDRA
jgi:AcrR family transcriptional regulator